MASSTPPAALMRSLGLAFSANGPFLERQRQRAQSSVPQALCCTRAFPSCACIAAASAPTPASAILMRSLSLACAGEVVTPHDITPSARSGFHGARPLCYYVTTDSHDEYTWFYSPPSDSIEYVYWQAFPAKPSTSPSSPSEGEEDACPKKDFPNCVNGLRVQ